MKIKEPYDPLNKKNLGFSVADALLAKDVEPLPPQNPFTGAGVYAIYYSGDFEPYKSITKANSHGEFKAPIYVGKAVPQGARKGGFGLDAPPGRVLYNRLSEHADTIKVAKNLKIDQFCCRYLTVDDIWIPLGESLLIEMFNPLWNKVLDGFGNHDPGKGRYKQQRSPWDTIHPGRDWAKKLPAGKTESDILKGIQTFLSK
jgi:hypothetical protein